MASLVTLQARLEALDAAIASGVLIVRHGDTMTTFRSMDDLLKARGLLVAQIAAAGGTTRTRVRYFYQSDKGL